METNGAANSDNHTTPQYLNGPDQILPATKSFTTNPTERVKLYIEDSAYLPISVPGMLNKMAREYLNNPALAFKQGSHEWQFVTFKDYENNVTTCAKAFLRLGLQRYRSVCIMGFNAPEWFYSFLGAIYAGGLSAGLYLTSSEEACLYCAEHCNAEIIVVEDQQQLNKIINIKDKLKNLKAIVQYEGVISWEQLMKIGCAEPDTRLNNVLKTICINECCSIIFTSGTGMPKGVMLTHDNIMWTAAKFVEHFQF